MLKVNRSCTVILACVCLLGALDTEGLCGGFQYVVLGPPEMASFENALYDLLPVYACGIWPREEKLAGAVKSSRIPKSYVENTQKWLSRILKEDVQPEKRLGAENAFDADKWIVVPQLLLNRYDCLLGQFASRNKDIQCQVEFQEISRHITLAVNSAKLFPLEGNDYDDAKVIEAVCTILNIPQDKIRDLRVERHAALLGDQKIPTCYGKIRCNWDEHKSEDLREREWFSYLPFWIIKGKMCVGVAIEEKGELHPTPQYRIIPEEIRPAKDQCELLEWIDKVVSGRGQGVPYVIVGGIAASGDAAVPHLIRQYEKKENRDLIECLCKIGTEKSLAFVWRVLSERKKQGSMVRAIRNYPIAKGDDILPLLVEFAAGPLNSWQWHATERLTQMIRHKPSRAGALVAALKDDESAAKGNRRLYEILASVSGYSHTWPGQAYMASGNKFWRGWWARNKDKDRFGWFEEAVTSNPDESRQYYALGGMAGLRDKRAVPYLLKALDSPSEHVQYYAVRGLKYLDSGVLDRDYTYEKFVKDKATIIPLLRQRFQSPRE